MGVGRRRLRARELAERQARLRPLSLADHGRRHRAEHPRHDPVDSALPHGRRAVAQRDRLQPRDELPLHRGGHRRHAVQRLREPRMAADAGPRSASQHRRSHGDHGRLTLSGKNSNRFHQGIGMNSSSLGRSRWAACVAAVAAFFVWCSASAQTVRQVADGYIGGTVTSTRGPEAGVWVIAETDELKTPFIKIVVTDDAGRYVLPQLPTATYNVWVRGYGLADSDKVEGRPGDTEL